MANSELAHGPTMAVSHQHTGTAKAGDRLVEGSTCGEYVVDRFLGAGAMGEVYAGRHPLIGKQVAIKVLKRDLSASAEGSERFLREARAVNQVAHPNVIDVFAFGTLPDGRLYLVMDLVDGRSLREAVQSGPLPVDVALDVLAQIADALDAAHSRGVVHRDLKPDNVMLSGDPPKVFVLDFGIAKLVTNNATLNGNGTLTGEGSWLGTPGYMAPEQWSAEGAGPASDRYALGVMAFELMSGSLPFQAPTLPQMMEQHFRAPVPALSTRRGVVQKDVPPPPATLDPVLARAMAKDPTKRFATAKELVAALREAAAGKRFGPRKMWVPAAAGASVLGLSIVAVLGMRGDDKPAQPAGAPERTPSTTPPPPPPAEGQVAFEIISTPPGTVVRAGAVLGQTPYKLAVTPGEPLALTVKRLGYAPAKLDLVAPATAGKHEVELSPITGFGGVWRLGNGQLRKFERVDDHVVGYKLESLDDPGRVYRRFELVDLDVHQLQGDVGWVSNETTNEGPHPSCQVAFQVVYAYRAQPESLEAQVPLVKLRKQDDGTCVQRSRSTEMERLARVSDGGDEVVIRAPVGKPPVDVKEPIVPDKGKPAKPIPGKENALDDKQREQKQLDDKQQKTKGAVDAANQPPTPQTKGKRPPNPKSAVGNAFDDDGAQQVPQEKVAPNQSRNAPAQQKAPAQPIPQAPPPPQPQVNAPANPEGKVSGDSQAAPQVKKAATKK